MIHHRVTLSFTEFHQFEIKRIELRETLCYSVVKTHYLSRYELYRSDAKSITVCVAMHLLFH